MSSYSLTGVVQNRSISAAFIAEGAEYTINASAGTGGSISPSGDTSVTYGSDQFTPLHPTPVTSFWMFRSMDPPLVLRQHTTSPTLP